MKKKSMMKKSVAAKADDASSMKGHDTACVCAACYTDCRGWGLALLRVVVGAIFLYAGIGKFTGWPQASGYFGMLFGGAGVFLAGLVAVVEIISGLAFVLGFWTKWAGYLAAIIMVVAIVWAKKFAWPAIQLDLLLLVSAITIAWSGAGRWSIHQKCNCCDGECL